ncbi:MAG: AAA family ATPase [Eubacteriales bacterium]|nr:AAA family ATPase [Eubacteriales bacterium]
MNIKKAKEDIKNTVRAYLDKDDFGQYRIPHLRQRPILLMGPPGIGKTQIMEQIARECDIGLVSYTITHHTRQSAVGLPFIREETFHGKTYSVTEYTMSEIIASIYHYMEETGKKEGILFIDEINCVSETLAPTMLQFLQCKTFGNQAVPEGWIITAAGNPPEYNKSVKEFDFVTLDRVRKITLEANLEVFRSYARMRGLHPFILSYLELRPQNFYRTENDVDGLQFVTARGWEDLSSLIFSYESLGISVDEDVIGQFLQHEEVAKDVAAYYDLYKKYKEDYDISLILTGEVSTGIFERLFHASFDERLSCVELLANGVHNYASHAMDLDAVTDYCYEFLKHYRRSLKEGVSSRLPAQNLWLAHVEDRKHNFLLKEKTGLVTPEEKKRHLYIMDLLRQWIPSGNSTPQDAFQHVEQGFRQLCADREDALTKTSAALNHSFSFMEEAFGEGQEMVVFVTDLTLDADISSYIAQNGCEKYFQYNKTLLIGTQRATILKELNRDDIYSDSMQWDF